MRTVRVDQVTVTLLEASDGASAVVLDGQRIGYVWKGTRTYSPPTHKGSRIVKYHKQVPEWQGGDIPHVRRFSRDTRQLVLRELVCAAAAAST